MINARRMLPALGAAALLSLFLLYVLGAASAQAAGPATVTVRVMEGTGANNGPPYRALLPLTQVTTNETPVVKDGISEDSCAGTSAAGALQLATEATHGSWGGTWEMGEYTVETIDGVSYPFSTPPFYWNFWFDNQSSGSGVCKTALNTGDSILFFVGCYSTNNECPPTPPNVLAIEAPANVEVGKPVTVTVLSYPNEGGEPPMPAVGVTVEGGGDSNAPPTNAQGQTTLVFAGDGNYTIDAIGAAEPPTIPAEAFVCAHEGNDGTCGTTAPGNSPLVKSSPGSGGTVNSGSPAIETAKIAGVKNGHVYPRRKAPRLLKGSVVVPAGGLLRKVQISLRRSYRGRCYGFNGSAARFVAIKCKRAASFFSVGTKPSFSYLLPARLSAGRYTYEIQAVDGSGQATKLVSGISSVVFQVK